MKEVFLTSNLSKFEFVVTYVKDTLAATRGVLYEKVFFKISQNSQKSTYARFSILIKL